MKKRTRSWWKNYLEQAEERTRLREEKRLDEEDKRRKRAAGQPKRRSDIASPPSSGGGGGGRPVIQIGGTGPRGSRFPKVGYQKLPRSVIIKSKYIPTTKHAGRRLGIWLEYCTKDKDKADDKTKDRQADKRDDQRSGEPDMPAAMLREREFFTKDREGVSKEGAQELIAANFGRRPAYHQMILSSGDRNVDPLDYARRQMDALERKLGHKLTWVANVHRDTGPDKMHINVTIAGAIPEYKQPSHELKYESREIDLDRVHDKDKFQSSDGQWYTRYHSKRELKAHSRWLRKDEDRQIDDETFRRKLWRWIGAKEKQGDDVYGAPPLKDADRQKEVGEYEPPRVKSDDRSASYLEPEGAHDEKLQEFENVTDRLAHELTGGKEISPQGVRYIKESNRAASMIENLYRQKRLKESWNNHGDVYIDRETLHAMRTQGNYYVYMQRNFDREIDRAINRELGDRTKEREHDRLVVDGSRSLNEDRLSGKGEELFKQNMAGDSPDTISTDSKEHERSRERDDDDDGQRRR